jgi:surface protein
MTERRRSRIQTRINEAISRDNEMSRQFMPTNDNIKEAVNSYLNGNPDNLPPIGQWDTSQITDMSSLFKNYSRFNEDINNWNVSNVTDMRMMFLSAESFNQPLNKWNVSNVTDMNLMFAFTHFNQDISMWQLNPNVTVNYMFQECSIIDEFKPRKKRRRVGSTTRRRETRLRPLGSVSPIRSRTDALLERMTPTNMSYFINSEDTFIPTDANIKVAVNSYLNGNPNNLPPIGEWDTSQITDMSLLFKEHKEFNEDINNWNVSNVTNMKMMFLSAESFNQPLNKWNVSNVTDMKLMFSFTSFNQPLNNWNVSNVTDMTMMFSFAQFNQDISMWKLNPNVNMTSMFNECPISDEFMPRIQRVVENRRRTIEETGERRQRSRVSGSDILQQRQPETVSLPQIQNTQLTPQLIQIYDKINVFDPINVEEVSVSKFFEENIDYNPFIVRNQRGIFTGDAIDWPAPSSTGKEFIECTDDTPSDWQGNSYSNYIKQNGRRFIKINIAGSPTMIVKPNWYNSKSVPGTKIFNLVPTGKVFKFMSKPLTIEELPEDFTALGADHCNQTGELGAYILEEIKIEDLKNLVSRQSKGGKTQRRKSYSRKTKKNRIKKYNKNNTKRRRTRRKH